MYFAECTVTVRFDDKDVIDWLVGNEAITEEEAEFYIPTQEQIRDYAEYLIENDGGEYGSISVD